LHPLKESERKIMTKGLENLAESSEKEKINALFEQCIKEMRYLRNFSEHTLKGCRRVFNHWILDICWPDADRTESFSICD
jgi:repressor of nif and glnA expression